MKFENRRVASALAALAVVSGGLAAWAVQRELDATSAGSGPPTRVLSALATIEPGTRIDANSATTVATTIDVPAEHVPPDAISEVSELAGMRAVAEIPVGGYLTRGAFVGWREGGRFRLRRGERAVSVEVSATPDGVEPAPGSTVDLVASGVGGAQETHVLISGAEVLAVSEADSVAPRPDDPDAPPAGPMSRLTIRVTAAQMPAVIRADVFARELRAVVR